MKDVVSPPASVPFQLEHQTAANFAAAAGRAEKVACRIQQEPRDRQVSIGAAGFSAEGMDHLVGPRVRGGGGEQRGGEKRRGNRQQSELRAARHPWRFRYVVHLPL